MRVASAATLALSRALLPLGEGRLPVEASQRETLPPPPPPAPVVLKSESVGAGHGSVLRGDEGGKLTYTSIGQ